VAFHRTGTIEVGYSGYGPTIGLTGTLQATGRDQFVTSMKVNVTIKTDGAQQSFEWLVLRPYTFSLSSNQPPGSDVILEMPSSFLIPQNQPHKFNTLFAETRLQVDIQRHLLDLRESWQAFILDTGSNAALLEGGIESAVEGFRNSSTKFSETYTEIDRLFPWTPGSYTLSLRLTTDRELDVTYKTAFTVSEAESKRLRLNTYLVARAALVNEDRTFDFVYAQYQSPDS
jgi:hypothetical protein